MTSTITKTGSSQREAEPAPQLFDDWFDPIETEVRDRARGFIEELIRGDSTPSWPDRATCAAGRPMPKGQPV